MDLRIDAGRLWQSLMDLARIGATPLGGVRRITLTDMDRLGRDRVVAWFRAAGLEVRVDPIGNLKGAPGLYADAPSAPGGGSEIYYDNIRVYPNEKKTAGL